MIFVTVGSDLPFDRLVRVVDLWAQTTGRNDVFAQIGKTDYKPAHIPYRNFLQPAEFTQRLTSATTIIAHAGMGTILSALQSEKPVLVMPRRAALREVRNEHQLATARHLLKMGLVNVAFDEDELREQLSHIDSLKRPEQITAQASPQLVLALRTFIAGKPGH